MVRKAFKQARTERPGATFVILPEDIADQTTDRTPLRVNVPVDPAPSEVQVRRAAEVLGIGRGAVVLAGPGVARDGAMDALVRFSEALNLPVATTFLGKGVFPDDHPNALGTIGFMVRDYANFGFDEADVVVAVGYDLVEYAPDRWNPDRDKRIVHVHRTVAEVDDAYTLEVGVQGDIGESLDAIAEAAAEQPRREREQPGSGSSARSSPRARTTMRSRSARSGSCTMCARRSAVRTWCCATRVPPRSGWRGSSRRTSQHLSDLERSRHDGVRPAGRDRG